MTTMNFANVTIFVLFFGIALIEAFQKGNWIQAGIFLVLGLFSFLIDFKKGRK